MRRFCGLKNHTTGSSKATLVLKQHMYIQQRAERVPSHRERIEAEEIEVVASAVRAEAQELLLEVAAERVVPYALGVIVSFIVVRILNL
jgi:hypothetical protein